MAEDAVTAAARAIRPVPHGPRRLLWATCAPGFAEFAAAELAALGWVDLAPTRAAQAAQPDGRAGVVHGRADDRTIAHTLLGARTIESVSALLTRTRVAGLDEVRATIAGLDLAWLPTAPFAARATREGTHPFTSVDLAGTVGRAVLDRVAATSGRRLPVHLDAPEVVVRVALHDDELQVGVALEADPLAARSWRTAGHHAGLRPSTAAALLAASRWRKSECLLDPFTGGATIPIEAALAGRVQPLRGAAALTRLQRLGWQPPGISPVAEVASAAQPAAALAIIGRERYGRHVGLARANAAAAGLGAHIDLREGDATRLEDIGAVDVLVTNPPFGLRAGSPRLLADLYTRACARAAERLAPGGRIVLLSPAVHVVDAAADRAGLTLADRWPVRLGDLPAAVSVLAAGR